MTAAKYRPLKFGVTRATLRDGDTGVHYLRADQELQPFPERLTDRLVHWAKERPDQTLFARRVKNADGSTGDWQHITFAQALDAARRIGQGLLNRGLSAERPVLILSENDLEHALLALGCLYAGVAYCPTSPPYSLISQDFDKLHHVVKTLTPGLVFASDANRYARAMLATLGDDVELVCTEGTVPGRATTSFAALLATEPTPAVDAAMAA
ncbi:MAG: AMP-binding protein, partial [Hydrogenophaga sp.]|uniref:AMP-binding protein n=1 Tax=Hydrogenophaga sp. TaxID=1904254 RepID=UPI002ABC0A79